MLMRGVRGESYSSRLHCSMYDSLQGTEGDTERRETGGIRERGPHSSNRGDFGGRVTRSRTTHPREKGTVKG